MGFDPVLLGALGDIHADWAPVQQIMRRHPDVPAWICVGDLGDDRGVYERVPAPLYWIKGNNESFDAIAAGAYPPSLVHIPNGTTAVIDGVVVAGLGGTFAPTWYDADPAALPHPRKGTMNATALADKRRHFVRAEVEALVRTAGTDRRPDVLLTHEAPRPFRVGRMDAGKTPINELIAALTPRLHLFGHHHRFAEQKVHGVPSICLDLASRSYLLVDTATWEYEKLDLVIS
ncbi:MAG TPA: metallophosphoesterase [Vicinamibacterales bacterium]|nr:metallophosphoesterase [Vicinamibacterales bacterium]